MCIMLFVKNDKFYWNKSVNLYIQNQARLFMVDWDWQVNTVCPNFKAIWKYWLLKKMHSL